MADSYLVDGAVIGAIIMVLCILLAALICAMWDRASWQEYAQWWESDSVRTWVRYTAYMRYRCKTCPHKEKDNA